MLIMSQIQNMQCLYSKRDWMGAYAGLFIFAHFPKGFQEVFFWIGLLINKLSMNAICRCFLKLSFLVFPLQVAK